MTDDQTPAIPLSWPFPEPAPPWLVHRTDHGSIECRDCGADAGLGGGTPGHWRSALRYFAHNDDECSYFPKKSGAAEPIPSGAPVPTPGRCSAMGVSPRSDR